MLPIPTDITVAAHGPSVHVSVTLVRLAKAINRNKMSFGRDNRVVPSTGRGPWPP